MLSSFAAKRQRCPNAQNLCSLKNAQLKQLTPYRLSIVTDLPRGREGGGEGGREGEREVEGGREREGFYRWLPDRTLSDCRASVMTIRTRGRDSTTWKQEQQIP